MKTIRIALTNRGGVWQTGVQRRHVGCDSGVRAALGFHQEARLERVVLRFNTKFTVRARAVVVTDRAVLIRKETTADYERHVPNSRFLSYLAGRGVGPGFDGFVQVDWW